jgi:hypothetical protein
MARPRTRKASAATGFWVVAVTFLTLAAFTTVPSPLYGLYQARDGFSEFSSC